MFTFWQFVLIIGVISFIIGWLTMHHNLEWEEFISFSLAIWLVFFIIFSISAGIGIAIYETSSKETNINYYYKDKEYLLTLKDDTEKESNINGSFVGAFSIGIGSVSSSSSTKKYYYTMSGTNEEGYVLKKYECENTYLFFDEEEQPYIQIKKKSSIIDYPNGWLFGGLLKPLKSDKQYEIIKTELHVPKNTIKIKYDVDME